MNYYFIPANDDTFFYAFATKLSESDAIYYCHVNRAQRRSRSYEPPIYPVYRAGTIQQWSGGDWSAVANDDGSKLTGTLDECKKFLIEKPLGDLVDLSRIDPNA